MLHPINLDLLGAMARHHPDGRPKDPMEEHRRTVLQQRRSMRRDAIRATQQMVVRLLRRALAARPPRRGSAPSGLAP